MNRLGALPSKATYRGLLSSLVGMAWKGKSSGIAAMEFAMLAPLMVLLMMGMACFGFYFTYQHEIAEITSGATRASVAGLTAAERASLAQQFVSNAIVQSAIFTPADVTVTTNTTGTPATNFSVTVAYNLKDTPIPDLARIVSLQLPNITQTSTVEFGGY